MPELMESRDLIDPGPWIKAARVLAQDAGLSIKYDELSSQPQPRVDLKNKVIYVPMPNPYWKHFTMKVWLGMIMHEIGHCTPKCRDSLNVILEKNLDMTSELGVMFNLMDDYRQEKTDYGEYLGRDQSLSAVQGWCADISRHDPNNVQQLDPLRAAVFCWVYNMRSLWQTDVSMHVHQWDTLVDANPDAKSAMSDLLKYSPRLDALPGSPAIDAYQLALDILSEQTGKDQEEIEQESQQQEGDGDGGGGHGQGIPQEVKDALEAARKLMAHAHESADKLEVDAESGTVNVKQSNDHSEEGEPMPFNVNIELTDEAPYTYKGRYAVVDSFLSQEDPYHSSTIIKENVPSKLGATVRKLLQVRTQTKYKGGYKRGRLNSRALYKYRETDALFKRKETQVDLNVCVQLVVDCSGSMNGSRYNIAAACAAALVDALQPNNIPVEVLGFTDNWSPTNGLCKMYVFKSFSTQMQKDELIQRMASNTVDKSSNPDGEALLFAMRSLAPRSEKRKVMIVLSDGQPTSFYSGNERKFLRDTVAMISKRVEVYGIGIESDSVAQYYPEHYVLNDASELKTALLSTIKSKILGD